MYNKINYMVVGIFVLVFGAGMIWFAFWLAKWGLQDEYDIYKIEIKESVSGLSEDASVKIRGVDVGRVQTIRINPQNIEAVEIFLEIKKGTPIKEDMVAHTQMFGVTGLLSIEIDGGTNTAKTLQPSKTYIPFIQTKTSYVSRVSESLGEIADSLNAFLIQTKKLISDKNIQAFENTLGHIEKITSRGEELEIKAIGSLAQLDETLQELRVSMKDATHSFEGATKDFASIKDRANPLLEELTVTTRGLDRLISKAEKSLDRGDYNIKNILEPALVDVQILSSQINDLAQQLKQSPSDVLFKARKQRKGPGE
ncbi:MAG TPA: ABC transporter substrate-binding protein [Sulfurovum sp. UBA12169]|nr:MAG TPA: ABC transporter substrate-binding protein [Sulfurovum sp. UBA12169]